MFLLGPISCIFCGKMQQLLAVGTETGRVLLVSVPDAHGSSEGPSHCAVVGEYEVHGTGAARGLQWATRHRLLSFSTAPSGASTYCNSVKVLSLPSGRCTDAVPVDKNAPAPI